MARTRTTHSLEAILEGAIVMLDESGAGGLTLRGLAARLGGGVGSLYWYVDGKSELLDRATDHLAGVAVERAEARIAADPQLQENPVATLRQMSMSLFEVLEEHPWMATHLMRDVDLQRNSLLIWDRVGQQVMRLGLTDLDCFYGTSAVINYVVGVAAQMGFQGPNAEHATRAEFLQGTVTRWSELPEDEFPYAHSMLEVFPQHDDHDQFAYGLDLLLEGLHARGDAR